MASVQDGRYCGRLEASVDDRGKIAITNWGSRPLSLRRFESLLQTRRCPRPTHPMTPPIPRTLVTEPNDSATQPKALIPSMEVAVAMAVYTAITRPTMPGGATLE